MNRLLHCISSVVQQIGKGPPFTSVFSMAEESQGSTPVPLDKVKAGNSELKLGHFNAMIKENPPTIFPSLPWHTGNSCAAKLSRP
jgi:hypothetical protein